MRLLQKICTLKCLILNAVACAMRTKDSGVQGRRARSARYAGCANVVRFDLISNDAIFDQYGIARAW